MIEIRKYDLKKHIERKVCDEPEQFAEGTIRSLNKHIKTGYFWGVRTITGVHDITAIPYSQD